MVFSEADLLPGLDRRQVQRRPRDAGPDAGLRSRGTSPELSSNRWRSTFPIASVLERVDPHIRQLEQLPDRQSQLVRGDRSSTIFTLNGVRFHFDGLAWSEDGRFPRSARKLRRCGALRARRGAGLSSPIRAASRCIWRGFASSVTAVDSSRPALEVAEQNEQLNRAEHRRGEIEWIEANAFDLLKDYATAGRQYDTIVLDPPAFAKTKRAVPPPCAATRSLTCVP